MWKFTLFVLMILSLYMFFNSNLLGPSLNNFKNQAINTFSQEKTVQAVHRQQAVSDQQNQALLGK